MGKPEGKSRYGVDGRLILRWSFRKWDGGGLDWIDLTQVRDRRRALVSSLVNLRVPKCGEILD